MASSFPWNSPFSYAENDVIRNIDLDGAEKFHYLQTINVNGETELTLQGVENLYRYTFSVMKYLHGGTGIVRTLDNSSEVHIVHIKERTYALDPFGGGNSFEVEREFSSFEEMINAGPQEISTGLRLAAEFEKAASVGMMGGGGGGSKNMLRGFKSYGSIKQFGTQIQSFFAKKGLKDVKLFMQGSSATGKSYAKGIPFDVGRVSDFDVAIAHSDLFKKAKELGIVDKVNKSIPIKAGSIEAQKLGVDDLLKTLSKDFNREVNIRIFDTVESVREAGKAVAIPTEIGF